MLRYDQNTPPQPGVPQIPLGESFARLNEYPDGTYRELRQAAAALLGVGARERRRRRRSGRPDRCSAPARSSAPGRRAAIAPPTYAPLPDRDGTGGRRRRRAVHETARRPSIWRCNPNNPTGAARRPGGEIGRRWRAAHPRGPAVGRRRGIRRVRRPRLRRRSSPSCRTSSCCARCRRRSALLRCASAMPLAAPEIAAELDARRAPAPVSAPAARIAAAALREPRFDVRGRGRARARPRGAARRGLRLPPGRRATSSSSASTSRSPTGWRSRDSSSARSGGIRVTLRRPARERRPPPALGATPARAPGREARTRPHEQARRRCGVALDLDGRGRARVETGVGFLDHLLTLLAFHAGFDLELRRRRRSGRRRAPHRRGRVASLGNALMRRWGIERASRVTGRRPCRWTRRAPTAAVDLVRRAHAEIDFAFPATGSGHSPFAAAARARASRDRGGIHDPRGSRQAATTTTSPRPPSRRSDGRCGRPCALGLADGGGAMLDEGRGSRRGRCSPTTARGTCAASCPPPARRGRAVDRD